MDLKREGNAVYLVGVTKPELGGSEYYRLMGSLGASVPRLEAEETAKAYRRLTSAIDAGLVRACHDLSEGGLGAAAAEMAFTGGLGLELNLDSVLAEEGMRDDVVLFSESNGRLLIEVPSARRSSFEELMDDSVFARVGTVTAEDRLIVYGRGGSIIDQPLDELMSAWKTPLGVSA